MTFRTKIFLAALGAAALAVLAATLLVSWPVRNHLEARIEQELATEARSAAELLSHRVATTDAQLDSEADALGAIVTARVTFIAADGRVVGDSQLTRDQVRTLENHGTRPEVVQAFRQGGAERLAALGEDRARLAAILAGMIEGVIVVNEHGRLQLANDAARRLLRIDVRSRGGTIRKSCASPPWHSRSARRCPGARPTAWS